MATNLLSSQEVNGDKIDQTTEIESSVSTDCIIRVVKMFAVHLAGKRKEMVKIYMAVVLETDGEDVNLLDMARRMFLSSLALCR